MPEPGQLDMFSDGPARARNTDPGTSHKAAKSVKVRESQMLLLRVLKKAARPMTDEDIAKEYQRAVDTFGIRQQRPSGLRTRRKELVELNLVRNSGQTTKLESGREAILWEVV